VELSMHIMQLNPSTLLPITQHSDQTSEVKGMLALYNIQS